VAREDDIPTLLGPGASGSDDDLGSSDTKLVPSSEDELDTMLQRSAASHGASVSGFDRTVPGHLEQTAPGSGTALVREQAAAKPGDKIGNFVVEKMLGRGAMGVVLLAHDPELDRRVAIKLLRVDDQDEGSRIRLLREAQSAGGIGHPNVVAVHQAGTHEGQVYVVMEFVDGGTLREWIEEEPRSWEEIVEVYVQAGRGLAAAHALGLVHRDFKPDNVLIGVDGRVRVSDFGLVGRSGDTVENVPTLRSFRSFDESIDRLTQTGTVMGTPAYMSPEQLSGERVDPASDQFSYSVAFYEALYGERPYRGDTLARIVASIATGEVEVPSSDVPTSVRDALVRGLRPTPSDRHESMEAMLDALAAHRAPPQRRGAAAAAGVALLGLGAAGAYFIGPTRDEAPKACPDADEAYGSAWSDERRAAVEAAFATKPTGSEMFAVLDRELAARQSEWIDAWTGACDDRNSGKQTDALYELRVSCLHARRDEADVFSELLTGDDERLLDGALSGATALIPVAACEDVEALQAVPQPTDDQANKLVPLRRELARARILLLAGRHNEVAKLMADQTPALREVGFAADLAAALEITARAQMQVAEYDKAEANLREAITLAAEARAHATEARAIGTLIFIVGQWQKRYDEANGMLAAGRSAAARSSDPRALSYLEAGIASLHIVQEQYEEGDAALAKVIDTLESLERPPPDELANAYSNRADLRARTGDMDAALADHQRAVAIVEEGLGRKHPFYGAFAMQLGISRLNREEYDDAIASFRDTLASWEATYGPNHSSCALAVQYIGIAQSRAERLADAAKTLEDGIRRHEASDTADDRGLVTLVDNLAHVRWKLGQWDAAKKTYERARSIVLNTAGEDDPRVAGYDQAVGAVLVSEGRYLDAIEPYERARTRHVTRVGPKHPDVAAASAHLGLAYLLLNDCQTAQKHFGAALRIRSDLSVAPDDGLALILVGSARCDLARGEIDAARESIEHAAKLASATEDDELRAELELAQAELAWKSGESQSAADGARTAAKRLRDLGTPYEHRAKAIEATIEA